MTERYAGPVDKLVAREDRRMDRPVVCVLSMADPNIFPALHHLASGLAAEGAEVYFVGRHEPGDTGVNDRRVTWVDVPRVGRLGRRIPGFRSNYHGVFGILRAIEPDWIVAQHEYIVPGLIYKLTRCSRKTKVAMYFADYNTNRWYTRIAKRLSRQIDVYVDVCDMRLQWRHKEWPEMRAMPFVIRNAPQRRPDTAHEPHQNATRIVFTSSKYVLGLNRDRLSRFLSRLCEHGISVDWYLPGADEVRSLARSLTAHPLYTVHGPVEKSGLIGTLAGYDVGLHWAPMAEKDFDPEYFYSAASNKIGEYIAAGLVVAHAGNPGLSYLPEEICAVFDPTDPEAGANRLAAVLSDRAAVERKRQAALRYHDEEMNFAAQAASLIRHVIGEPPGE